MNVSTEASHYASIESKGNKLEDVEIKFLNTIPKRHINNILISKALAEKLEIKEDQEVKILRVYQKTSDINLDEL